MNFTLVTPGVGGVYAVVNTSNHKVYVGQSRDIARRLGGHKSELRGGQHFLPSLQSDFNLFGEHVFMVRVLEPAYNHRTVVRIEAAWIHALLRSNISLYNRAVFRSCTHMRITPTNLYMTGTFW
jgi:group I intron endonuclease